MAGSGTGVPGKGVPGTCCGSLKSSTCEGIPIPSMSNRSGRTPTVKSCSGSSTAPDQPGSSIPPTGPSPVEMERIALHLRPDELNANQIEEDIYYPTSQGEINTNPYDLVELIVDKSSNIQIEDFAWSITDDKSHTTHPDAWGRMDHLRRADADARGLTPTIVEDQEMEQGVPDLLAVRAKAVIGLEAHLKDPNFFGSSRHLQIGVYNLGNLDRRWIRHYQDPPILKILRDQPNHLQHLCEGPRASCSQNMAGISFSPSTAGKSRPQGRSTCGVWQESCRRKMRHKWQHPPYGGELRKLQPNIFCALRSSLGDSIARQSYNVESKSVDVMGGDFTGASYRYFASTTSLGRGHSTS
eukprot:6491868-Amphidinium_carterae.2